MQNHFGGNSVALDVVPPPPPHLLLWSSAPILMQNHFGGDSPISPRTSCHEPIYLGYTGPCLLRSRFPPAALQRKTTGWWPGTASRRGHPLPLSSTSREIPVPRKLVHLRRRRQIRVKRAQRTVTLIPLKHTLTKPPPPPLPPPKQSVAAQVWRTKRTVTEAGMRNVGNDP